MKRLTTIDIDVDEDFDGPMLELAILEADTAGLLISKAVLLRLHHLWVTKLGHPEWSKETDHGRLSRQIY